MITVSSTNEENKSRSRHNVEGSFLCVLYFFSSTNYGMIDTYFEAFLLLCVKHRQLLGLNWF